MNPPAVQDLVAPAVMISACGVLMIAASTRAASVLGQLHAMHRERADLVARIAAAGREPADAERTRAEGLEILSDSMLARARALRVAMIGIVACVMCMLVCSGVLAAGWMSAALVVFLLGVLALFVAMIFHIIELAPSLREASLEHARSHRFMFPDVMPVAREPHPGDGAIT